MASLQKERTGKFHIVIFSGGKRHKRSLGTKKRSFALARQEEIEEVLDLVKRGRLSVPPGMSLIDFAMANGKVEPVVSQPIPPAPQGLEIIPPPPTVQPVAAEVLTL